MTNIRAEKKKKTSHGGWISWVLKNDSRQVLDVLLAGYEKLPQEAEIVWRLCRAYFDLSEMQPKESRKEYLEVGFQFADKGLAIDKNNALFHKWWAIFCSLLGDYQPTKEKIGTRFL